MKHFLLTLSFVSLLFSAYSQTTQKEYDFLTKDYAALTAKGVVPELEGYYLEDLLELSDKTGLVKLLYKTDQTSITPVATQFQIYDNDRTFYICVPNEQSSKNIYSKYQSDLQNIFQTSSNAQSIFSIIVIQYPIELRKYFDEIKALEKTFADNNDDVDEKEEVDPPAEKQPDVNISSKVETKVEDNGAKVIREPQNGALVVQDYESKTPQDKKAVGQTKQQISGGLVKRKLLARPALFNPSGKQGIVKVNTCIDGKGEVIKVSLNTRGTTTKDEALIDSAIQFAQKYTFNKSSLSRQCGFITIEFK